MKAKNASLVDELTAPAPGGTSFLDELTGPNDRDQVFSEIKKTPWFSQFKQHYGEEPDLNSPDYDYYGAWKSGVRPVQVDDHEFDNPVTKKREKEFRWDDSGKRGAYLGKDGMPNHDKSNSFIEELTKSAHPKDPIDDIPVIGTYWKEGKHALSSPDAQDFIKGITQGAGPGESIFNVFKGAKVGLDLAGAGFAGTIKNLGDIVGKGEEANQFVSDLFVRGINNPINQLLINSTGDPKVDLPNIPKIARKMLLGDSPDGAPEILPTKGPSSEDVVRAKAKQLEPFVGKIDTSPEAIQKNPLLWGAKTGLDVGEMILGGKALHAGTKAMAPKVSPIVDPVVSPLKKFVKDNTPGVIQKWLFKEGEAPLEMADALRELHAAGGRGRELANEIVNLMTYESEAGIVPSKLKGRKKLSVDDLNDLTRYVEMPEARWSLEKGELERANPGRFTAAQIIRDRWRELEDFKIKTGLLDPDDIRRQDPAPTERTVAETELARPSLPPQDANYIPYNPRDFFHTVFMKENQAVLESLYKDKNFNSLPPELQETISKLVTGGADIPEHLKPRTSPTGTSGNVSMEAMRHRKDLPPQAIQLLGGEVPKSYLMAKRFAETLPTGQLIDFVNQVRANGYIDGRQGVAPGKGQVVINSKSFGESILGKKISEILLGDKQTGLMHKGLYNEINSFLADRGVPDLGTIGKAHEFVLNPWKKMTTILWPKTALNNSIWNKTVSWIMTGNKQKSDREFTQRAMNTAYDTLENQVAEKMGVTGSSFVQSELASESQMSLAKQVLKSIQPETPLTKASAFKEALVDKAGQWYQGSEVKAKMEIGCARLRELGYEFKKNGDGYELKKGDRTISSKKDFLDEDLRAFKDAGDMGNFALFDYADVSRAVKLLNKTTHPFITFGTKIMPLMMRLAMGVGHNGEFSAARMARFWSVPIMSKMLTEFSKHQNNISDNEYDAIRDSRPDASFRRSANQWAPGVGDALSDTVNPLLPFSTNPKTGKTMFGRDRQAGYMPVSAGLANALPYAQIFQPQGTLDVPALVMPGGPVISNFSLLSSETDPYTQRKVISKESPDKRRDALLLGLQKAFPPAYLARRVYDAAQGLPPRKGYAPETIPGAAYNVGSPIKWNVIDTRGAEFSKDTAKKDMEADIKRKQGLIDNKIAALNGRGNADPRLVKQLELEKEIEALKPLKYHLEKYNNTLIRRKGSPEEREYKDVSSRLEKAEQARGGILQGIKTALSGKDKISDIYHKIQDGDTFDTMYHGQKVTVRVSGIDAPETDHAYQGKRGEQPFSEKSKRFSEGLISGRKLQLNVVTKDKRGRLVARVIAVDKEGKSWDLAKELVKAGLAWHYQDYTTEKEKYSDKDRATFRELEEEAIKNKKGLWAEELPIKPGDWRNK